MFNIEDLCYTYADVKVNQGTPTLPPSTIPVPSRVTAPVNNDDDGNSDGDNSPQPPRRTQPQQQPQQQPQDFDDRRGGQSVPGHPHLSKLHDFFHGVFNEAPQDPSTLPIGVAPKPVPGVKPVDKTVSIRPAVPVRSNDRSELLLLRKRKPMNAAWLKMNGLNVDEVRKHEAELNDIIEKLNNIPGFISLSALWNRPGAIAKIAASKATTFKVTINKASVAVQVPKQAKDNLQIVADIHAKVKATLGVEAMQDISGVRDEVLKVLGGDGGFPADSINNPLAERKQHH